MTDRTAGRRPRRNGGRVLRPRAWVAPVAGDDPHAQLRHPPAAPAEPARGAARWSTARSTSTAGGSPATGSYAEALPRPAASEHAFVWLGLHEPDAAEMTAIADTFGLHELAVEDAVKAAAAAQAGAVRRR